MKQLNSIMEILGDDRTRTEYIEKISNVKEVIIRETYSMDREI